jgi:hypothetical protein
METPIIHDFLSESSNVENQLLSFAYIGRINIQLFHRLHYANRSLKAARNQIKRFHSAGWLEAYNWHQRMRTGALPPVDRGFWFALTAKGRQMIRQHAMFPLVYVPARDVVFLPHDSIVSETIVQLIMHARWHPFSGIYVEREAPLDPERPQPLADALVALRFEGEPAPPTVVPWTTAKRQPHERVMRFAVEVDRGTELANVIAAKADAYRELDAADIPLWVVPSEARRQKVMEIWRARWPDGKWMIATDDDLETSDWLAYHAGNVFSWRFTPERSN